LLLTLVIAGLAFAAASRVYGRTRILELGAEITELTAEQGRLLDERRRLQAERAYLRHPSHIQRLAGGGGGLAPADPARIQAIELRSAAGDAADPDPSDAEDRER
jgi:cell division protein FtsL